MTPPVQPYIPKREVDADNIIFDFGGVMMQHEETFVKQIEEHQQLDSGK